MTFGVWVGRVVILYHSHNMMLNYLIVLTTLKRIACLDNLYVAKDGLIVSVVLWWKKYKGPV